MFVENRVGDGLEGDGLWVLREGEGEGGKKEVEEERWEGTVMHGVGNDQDVKMIFDFFSELQKCKCWTAEVGDWVSSICISLKEIKLVHQPARLRGDCPLTGQRQRAFHRFCRQVIESRLKQIKKELEYLNSLFVGQALKFLPLSFGQRLRMIESSKTQRTRKCHGCAETPDEVSQ